MKHQIDNQFLADIGLGDLPLEEKDLLIAQIYEQLQARVGTRIAENLSDTQLQEFDEQYIQTNDQQGAAQWLQTNYPDYPRVVEEELGRLKQELSQQAGDIRSVIQQQQPPQQPPQAAADSSSE